MGSSFLHITPTAFDLLALFICIGALACHLWVLPPIGGVLNSSVPEILRIRLWHLIAVAIAMLTMSSVAELLMRGMEMSDRPLSEIFSVMPIIILRTHYGNLWLVRPVAIMALWIGWWAGRRRLDSCAIPAFMLGAGVVIAMTRSASGHAADMGDLTLPELMDCLHLLAGSIWGGGLMVLSTVVLPKMVEIHKYRRALIAYIAHRFSTLAGIALSTVLVTATYNTWIQVGSFRALWETPYGRIVVIKILLLFVLIVIGVSNRYISVPFLRKWACHTFAGHGPFHRLFIVLYFALFNPDLREDKILNRFRHKVFAEAILVVVVIICTAILLHGVPARHSLNTEHRHTMERGQM